MKLFLVGIGAGAPENRTLAAVAAIEESEVIIGYTVYVELVKDLWGDREIASTPMLREVERCRMALTAAVDRNVAMVCSGDSVVYGMAGLCYELLSDYPGVEIEVVSGVTAALGGGALLGAPLTHDFAVISLSDLLTPWEKIEARLHGAAAADFVLCLYNPSSKKRANYLERACAIVLEHQPPETVCGIAQNIGRPGETARVLSLAELQHTAVDMFSTVFIGNHQTRVIGGKMVTPRGYRHG